MADEDDGFETVPLPVQESTIGDGDCIIFDIFEFCEAICEGGAYGAMLKDGNLFVLPRETLVWTNVEDLKKKPKGRLAAVKKD